MRVKLLIALAIASIFLLAGVIPAGAVHGKTGPSGVNVNVGSPNFVAPVVPSIIQPCISFPAAMAPTVGPCGPANLITLGGPALAASFTLTGPQIPSFSPPNFVLPQLSGPIITPFMCTAPVFDP